MSTFKIVSRKGPSEEKSAASTLTTTYTEISHFMATAPDGSPWQASDLTGGDHGFEATSVGAGDEERVTQFFAVVDMTGALPDPNLPPDPTDPEVPPPPPPTPPPDPTDPNEREIAGQLIFNWNLDGVTWVEEIQNLISLNGEHSLVPPVTAIESSQGIISRMNVTLKNVDNRYSSMVPGAALYAFVADGKAYHVPVIFQVSKDAGQNWHRVFTGVVKLPAESTVTPSGIRAVVFECRGNEEQYINDRFSTDHATFLSLNGSVESAIFNQILGTQLGLTPSDEYALDAGTWSIPYFYLDDESVIEALWLLAASVGGRFRANKFGVFVYENNAHWLQADHVAPREGFTRDDDTFKRFGDLRIRWDDVNLSKTVSVNATLYNILPEQTVFETPLLGSVGPGETKTFNVDFGNPVLAIASVTYQVTNSAGGGASASVARTDLANGAQFVVTNGGGGHVFIRNLRIVATPVAGDNQVEVQNVSQNAFWTGRSGRTRRINNPYIRDGSQASFVSTIVLQRQEVPVATFVLSDVPGEGDRDLGDHISIYDDKIMSGWESAHITKLSWRYNSRGFYQDIEAIERSAILPNGGGGGDGGGGGPTNPSDPGGPNNPLPPTYFIINESLLAGTDVLYY